MSATFAPGSNLEPDGGMLPGIPLLYIHQVRKLLGRWLSSSVMAYTASGHDYHSILIHILLEIMTFDI